jgi:hypothetical protein
LGVKRPKIWPACIAKDAQRIIVRLFMKKELNRGAIVDNLTRKDIYKICCGQESFIPKL